MEFEIYEKFLELVRLMDNPEVLWLTFPLILTTLIMIFYYEKYKEERPGWNTHVANTLVLIFVSIMLIKYTYSLEGSLQSFIVYLDKFLISVFMFFVGFVLLAMNFEHFLPRETAREISSPLIVNSLAYVLVLRVYSNEKCSISLALATLTFFVVFYLLLRIVRFPMGKFFQYVIKKKKQEKIDDIKHERKVLAKEKRELRGKEKLIKKEKLRKIKEEKKEAEKMKRALIKPKSRKKKGRKRKKKK